MIVVDIPGYARLSISHLVLDYNGTLAQDGHLLEGVRELFLALSSSLEIHVVTADTFGRASEQLKGLPCRVVILPEGDQAAAKLAYVQKLGLHNTISIGNGRNDRLMLKESRLGIALVQAEGSAIESFLYADIVCKDVIDAISLITHPKRLIATLRS